MKLNEILYEEKVDEGLKQKALAGILSLGLAFANQVGAAEVFVYTDNDGGQQVVRTYDEVPKGKIAYVVDVEDMDVKQFQKRVQKAWKAEPALRDVPSETRKQMYRTDI